MNEIKNQSFSYRSFTQRTFEFAFKPVTEALRVEEMPSVAFQFSHLIVLLVFLQANATLLHVVVLFLGQLLEFSFGQTLQCFHVAQIIEVTEQVAASLGSSSVLSSNHKY